MHAEGSSLPSDIRGRFWIEAQIAYMEPINGKTYELWGGFVDKKEEWIGGTMIEMDSHFNSSPTEKITDVRM
jgi:hypothetical protein